MSERGRATPPDASTSDGTFADDARRPATREALSSAQHAELLGRLRGNRRRTMIPLADRSVPLPLSFHQERIWLHERLVPGSVVYNRPTNIRLRGPLQIELLRQALSDIVARHDSLRTNVQWAESPPTLSIQTHAAVDLPVTDLSADPAPEQRARQFIQEEVRHPIDLRQAPLLRCRLLRIKNEDHLLLLTFHHFAFDAWSQGVLWDELARNYAAYVARVGAPVRTLAIQYADFAAWDRSERRVAALAEGRSYWRRELADPPVLQLQTDFPRPCERSELAGQVELELPEELVARLRDLVRCERTTLFSMLLAALAATLHRTASDRDIVVGCPVAGRSRVETEPLIGVFINTLPMRMNVTPEDTFRELMRRVHETVLGGLQFQDVPLQMIVQDVLTERDPSRSPLFQVMFNYERSAAQSKAAGGVTFEPQEVGPAATLVDLSLELTESSTRISGRFVYRVDLWEQATIARLAGHFLTLLAGIVAVPDQSIGALPLLTEPERRQLTVEWNQTENEFPSDECVHDLFEKQVERTPDAVAIDFGGEQLTYRELNSRANQLAYLLMEMGVGPECLVVLALERSLELVVAVLATQKAGGAYVPLDPEHPFGRRAKIIADAAPVVIVSRRLLNQQFPDRIPLVWLDDCQTQAALVGKSAQNPTNADRREVLRPEHLAYVIYTSGSTGTPKGVMLEHRSLVNQMAWLRNAFPVAQNDRVLFRTSISFDASVWEMWLPLLCGAQLCIASQETTRDPASLLKFMDEAGITIAQFVPTMFSAVMDEGNRRPSRLRLVFSGGEPLIRELAQKVISAWNVPLVNLYGPTEATIQVTHCLFRDAIPVSGTLPIGKPIWNVQVYVLDSQRKPVPIGVPGELFIGGAALARGYLNCPELTAKEFVSNPFSGDPNSRLYRTGDLCRWRSDGNLEFLGRIDEQVKLRGFRIELGEIEAVLNQHPAVMQSVVVLREDRPGDKRLVAYYVPATDVEPKDSELRDHLQSRLPDYMVPSVSVPLEAFPLGPSGKVNRRALPAPDGLRPALESEYFSARNVLEEQLASIWRELLGIEQVGIHDNFFALGGHSLLAARVAMRASTALGVELSVSQLFESPTVAELAEAIHKLPSRVVLTAKSLTRIDRAGFERLPLSFAQQRLWFLEQMEGDLTAYNMPYAWRLRGVLHTEALQRAFESIVQRHEPLRTTFAVIEEEPVQVIQAIHRFELPLENLTGLGKEEQDAEVARRCREEAERPFDLTRDLMLRVALLRLADDEHVLLLTMHHIASDGWSVGVLWRDLAQYYDAYCRGTALDLPDLPVQYADYAVWQRGHLQGQQLERLQRYWRNQLADLTALELPTDRPRPRRPSHRGMRQDFTLRPELVRQLESLSQSAGVTLHMTLLSSFQTLLARSSGQKDITVGTPIAGRNHAALEDLIGFFVNTLALRTDLSGDPTFRELLGRVRHVSLAAYDHQELPFEKLVEELRPERQLNRNPLVQVMFQLMSFSDQRLSLLELEAYRLSQVAGRVKFDLELCLKQPEANAGFEGTVVYSVDLFDAATIQRMVRHWMTLLEGIAANADQRISELPLLTEAERRVVVTTWNQTQHDYPQLSVSRLFEQQAAKRPDAVAATCGAGRLTYAELNRRANRLARYLQRRGIGREDRVGICVERSFDMLVGLLAILKAGGAYVPLDPHFPDERLTLMTADAGTNFILVQRQFENRWRACDAQVLFLDDEQPVWLGEADDNLNEAVSQESLAYIIYTSGSTGVPKGVEVLHRGIVRLLCGVDYVHLDETQSILQLATLSFDASTFEIWAPLLHGGRCVLAPFELPDLQDLQRLIRQEHVRTIWLTSTLFNVIVDEHVTALEGVEQLLVGGEALSVSHVRRAQQALGARTQIINGYGPTECTTFACCYRLPVELCESSRSIPIGRPIANTTAYVLDANGRPALIGIPGELHLGGDGLARGYLNRPELTAEKFVENPFSDDRNSRLYRTGDLCRWLPDGNLEFLGRIDNQVKLRGFRIELGEIETALMRHASVRQVAVVLREDSPGNKRLVAYCVTEPTQSPRRFQELKTLLHSRLPDYMIPSAFVWLDALPRNANGKIDKRALPPPPTDADEEHNEAADTLDTPEEQLIAGIWRHVLGRDHVGLRENFFNLGGHSLSAIRMIDSVNRRSAGQLKVADVFVHPTVSELAQQLVHSRQAREMPAGGRYLEMIRPGRGPSTIIGVGTNLQALVKRLPEQAPIWWLKLDGTHVWPHLDLSISVQAEIDIAELEAANLAGKMILFGFSYGGLLALEIARQLTQRGRREICIVLLEPSLPGNQQPRLAKRVSRHLQALSEPRIAGRVSYIARRLRNVIFARWHAWQSRWQQFRGIDIPAEQRWSYIEPLLMQQIRAYAPTAALPLDVHLIGRPEYLEANGAALQRIIDGQIITHVMSPGLRHQDVAKMEHSQTWVDVIQQLASLQTRVLQQNGAPLM